MEQKLLQQSLKIESGSYLGCRAYVHLASQLSELLIQLLSLLLNSAQARHKHPGTTATWT